MCGWVFGTVWSGFGGSEFAAGGFVMCMGVWVCVGAVVGVCRWVCGTVWSGFGGSECAAGGFVVCVFVCVCAACGTV